MTNITPADFAELVDDSSRNVRKFLRATFPKEAHPGKGSRWQLDGNKRNISTLTKKHASWKAEQAKIAAENAAKKAEEAAAEVVEVED